MKEVKGTGKGRGIERGGGVGVTHEYIDGV